MFLGEGKDIGSGILRNRVPDGFDELDALGDRKSLGLAQ